MKLLTLPLVGWMCAVLQIEVFAKVCLEGSKLAAKSVKTLMEAGLVNSIPDLYTMRPVSCT